MAENKDSFKLYTDQQGLFNELPDDQAGRLIKLIFSYVNDENPEPEELLLRVAFEPIKRQLKRDLKKYVAKCESNKENALKRWDKDNANASERMPNNANASERIKSDANHADKIREDKIREDKKKNKRRGDILMRNSGVSVEDIKNAFENTQDLKNANPTYYYNTALDWSDGKGAMRKDWVAVVRTIARRDLADGKLKIVSSVKHHTNKAEAVPEDYGKPSPNAVPMPDSLKRRMGSIGK